VPVFINIYDLSPYNDLLAPLGLGFFHSGVEFHNTEYCYGAGGGVISHRPRFPPSGAAPQAAGGQAQQQFTPFRMQFKVGEVEATHQEVQRVIDGLRGDWQGNDYHILTRNCNCFADELSTRLCGRRIPGWVNRAASVGVMFSCLLPQNMRPPVPTSRASSTASAPLVPAGRALGGASSISTSGPGSQPALNAEALRAQRLAALERRSAAAAAAAAAEEAETAPLSGRL
jgi:hypothetical protein